ncbi:MAG TPA: carboxypeptidase-like regulatory domain-containing protein, partial [Candidatus Thermoplasmatota archaeon]|nr:carboxypeptidase-like regulatory domain-containing protein [Candidatus Thermoplasmatota archaeon]
RTTATDAGGRFAFPGVGPGRHALQVHAPGFLLANTSGMAGEEVRVVLQPAPSNASYQLAYRFRGNLQCAFEALIISPSCDSALVVVPEDQKPFLTNQSFAFGADLGWRTIVVDTRFDDGSHPLLDGLRIAVRGARAPGGGGEYEQFGRWHNATSFTVRLEPGGTYPDGTGPLPGNFTGFRVDVYPHGKAYHAACAADRCFLGAGAGIDVTFDLFVTVFQGEPAPPGFTMLAQA